MRIVVRLAAFIFCMLLMAGCVEGTPAASASGEISVPGGSSSGENSPPLQESSPPGGEPLLGESSNREEPIHLTAEDLEKMREYVLEFAKFYRTPFSSVDQLDRETIGRNCLFQLCIYEEDEFETDEQGYLFVPRERLNSYVWEHFGIEDYEFPLSDDPRFLPRYDEEKDAYLFIAAGEGFWGNISIVDEKVEGETAAYAVRLEEKNVETGAVMKTWEQTYTFRIITGQRGYVLQAVSAL